MEIINKHFKPIVIILLLVISSNTTHNWVCSMVEWIESAVLSAWLLWDIFKKDNT